LTRLRPLAIGFVMKTSSPIRHDWTREEATALFDLPFNDLMFRAHTVHREHFDPNEVQKSTLLSIKTGGCPEDCAYCNQSVHHNTGLSASKLMEVQKVISEAKKAKEAGASRYCMGAAWRDVKERDMAQVTAMINGVKELGKRDIIPKSSPRAPMKTGLTHLKLCALLALMCVAEAF